MKLKIKGKVILMMILLIIIPITSLGMSSYITSSNMAKKQYTELGTALGRQSKTIVESQMEETRKALEELGSDNMFKSDINEENVANVIDEIIRTKDIYGFKDAYFASSDGTVHSASGAGSVDATNNHGL